MDYKKITSIKPEILKWARETTGFTIAEVSRKLKRSEKEIQSWEVGDASPSYPQLEKLAYSIYKRPIAIFFLPDPPQEYIPKHEFRTLPAFDLEELNPDTRLHIRHAHAYQLALKELYNDTNPGRNKIWQDIKIKLKADRRQQAAVIRRYLGVSLDTQASWHNDTKALDQWRKAIEEAGVFIFKAPFKQKDISGICLQDDQFPVIYINNSTTKTRQIFSLMHELIHILLHVNGLSKFENAYIKHLPVAEQKIEQFCNAIAAEILVPEEDFSRHILPLPGKMNQAPDAYFIGLANRYGVSREAILRRFLDKQLVGKLLYKEKAQQWDSQIKVKKGGDYYASKNKYLSERFSIEVLRQYYQNKITIEQASSFLGVKEKNFIELEHRILQGKAV